MPAAEAMAKSLVHRDIKLLTRFDPDYPPLLRELNDPPSLLYLRGNALDQSKGTVTVTGTRSAGAAGMELTSRLVKGLVRHDVQIVSTLWGGIDSAVHLAARSGGGVSFAVIDCGVDRLEHTEGLPVAIDILEKGGVISEYSPEVPSTSQTTLETNRLLAGMAQAVVVTEFYTDSTRTLDLLRACREIGKLAFVVIGSGPDTLSDEKALAQAHEYGANLIERLERVDDIVRSLV